MSDTDTAVQRLTAWIRDYGDSRPREFIGDVTMLLVAAKENYRLHGEIKRLQAIVDRLPKTTGGGDGMKTYWIVQLEPDMWIAEWSGDPGRTCLLQNARRFSSRKKAAAALTRARKWGPFPGAVLEEEVKGENDN